MTPQEQQMIESLFQRLSQAAAQAGPRDPQAEAFIQQQLASLPGAAYYMTQTLILQERALQQAQTRLAQQEAGQTSFLPGGTGRAPYQPAAPAGGYGPLPAYQAAPAAGGVGGFLAGAGKMALGVGGGILVADAAMSLAHDLFGQQGNEAAIERAYDQGYQQGFDLGDLQPGGGPAFDDPSAQWDQPGGALLDDDQQDDLGLSGDDGGQSW